MQLRYSHELKNLQYNVLHLVKCACLMKHGIHYTKKRFVACFGPAK